MIPVEDSYSFCSVVVSYAIFPSNLAGLYLRLSVVLDVGGWGGGGG
jgi:hypothetical protein